VSLYWTAQLQFPQAVDTCSSQYVIGIVLVKYHKISPTPAPGFSSILSRLLHSIRKGLQQGILRFLIVCGSKRRRCPCPVVILRLLLGSCSLVLVVLLHIAFLNIGSRKHYVRLHQLMFV
jgi:hypothetical protein